MNLIGQKIGDYRLLRLLGYGSASHVYLAEHKHDRSWVAVKILSSQATHEREKGWDVETRALSFFNHPHIVHMHEFGTHENRRFLVTDWAIQGTLLDLFVQITPVNKVTNYIKQVAYALQYLHTMQIVHRDIKPTNILVGRYENILLADLELTIDYRDCQSTSGTPAYAAPEQKRGHPCPASDQYALGVIVYQWLSGELPFRGSPAEMIAQHKNAAPPSLQDKFPRAVDEVIRTALAKDPASRFPNVRIFAEALEQACRSLTYLTPSQIAEVYFTLSPGDPDPKD